MHACMFLCAGSQDFSVLSTEEVVSAVQETSIKRLVVGPLDVKLNSSAVHRILKMVTCAMDHEYEPYCGPQPGRFAQQLTADCSLSSLAFLSALFYCDEQKTPSSLHFTISSSHCYFLPQPVFQHTAMHENSDPLDHTREAKPNTCCVGGCPSSAIDELIPGML